MELVSNTERLDAKHLLEAEMNQNVDGFCVVKKPNIW